MGRIGAVVFLILAEVVVTLAKGWGALMLYCLAPGPEGGRMALAGGFVAIGLAASADLFVPRIRRWAGLGYVAAIAFRLRLSAARNSPGLVAKSICLRSRLAQAGSASIVTAAVEWPAKTGIV